MSVKTPAVITHNIKAITTVLIIIHHRRQPIPATMRPAIGHISIVHAIPCSGMASFKSHSFLFQALQFSAPFMYGFALGGSQQSRMIKSDIVNI